MQKLQENESLQGSQEIFCQVDQWAAEAYLTALDACEPKYLTLLSQGIKIHNWLFDKINERWPEQVVACGFDYKGSKQFVHSLNYAVMPPKMAKESGMPLQVCEWTYGFYHNEFPAIKLRQQRIRRQLEETRELVTFLSRKRIFLAPINQDTLNDAYAWPSQSCIGELTNIALAKLYWLGRTQEPWMFPALNTHDGMAIRCYVKDKAIVKDRVRQAFNIPLVNAQGLKATIPVELAWGRNFNEKLDKEILRYD